MFLLLVLEPLRARAEPARAVVVLSADASDAEPWPEGTQAVIAELLSTGFGLTVRRAHVAHIDELSDALRSPVSAPEVTGTVAVFRRGSRGFAWVYHRRFGLEQVDMDTGGGSLATSRFVLRVVELLRDVDIAAQQAPTPAPSPSPVRPATAPAATARGPGAASRRAGPLRVWLGAGATLAGGLDGPLPLLSGSAAVGLLPLLGLEFTAGFAPGAAPARTPAGQVSLRAWQATAFFTFDPLPTSRVGFVLGLGGGVVAASATADADDGFIAHAAATRVGVLSARARAFYTWKRLQFVVGLDPGLLLPALNVTAGGERTSLIGRPWLATSAGVGVTL